MNALEKIKLSWWIILSFILFINGFGFIYIGFRRNNINWIVEGIAYEIPWLFMLIFFSNQVMAVKLTVVALIVMFASIVRSIWVAVKLSDVYDNEEKYTTRPIVVENHKSSKVGDKPSNVITCCVCLFFIFLVFAIIAIL